MIKVIKIKIIDPYDIQLLNQITAACVLRMIGYSLGDELWRASLNRYLNDK